MLAWLNFRIRRFTLLVQTKQVISLNYGSSTSSWKPSRWVRLDLLFPMRDICNNSNLNPLTKFTSSSRSTNFKDILIVLTHPPSFFLKFWLPTPAGEIWKYKTRLWNYAAGQFFLKGSGRLTLFQFNFFKVYHFWFYKLLYLLKNCIMKLKKKFFFLCHHNFIKKHHSKLSKNEPQNIP